MARLLERAAPGVWATSARLISVVGVAESVGAASGAAETSMVSFAPATLREKCRIGSVPEMTTTLCSVCWNPGAATLTMYSPIGTALKVKLPAVSELVVADQSEDLALIITIAPCTGRCCGSWMMPRIAPKTAAKAPGTARQIVSKTMRIGRMKPPGADECRHP